MTDEIITVMETRRKQVFFDTLISDSYPSGKKGEIHSTVTDLARFRGQSTCRQTETLSYYITIKKIKKNNLFWCRKLYCEILFPMKKTF